MAPDDPEDDAARRGGGGGRPGDEAPAGEAPVDATPVDATPVDATPVDATPVDATPVDATPVDATPVDATVVRSTDDERRVDEWSLVLAAAGIPHRVDRERPWAGAFYLIVPTTRIAAARLALEGWDQDQAQAAPPPPPPAVWGWSVAGLVAAVAIAVAHAVAVRVPDLYRRGDADAARVVAGEWWRAFTALLLHADGAHLLSNVGGLILFVTALAFRTGPGVALLAVVVGGGAGNLLNALVHHDHHRSIGASTAVFAAVATLGAVELVRRLRLRGGHLPRWTPLAASLGLLAMLGAAKESDLLAHLFGFVVGLGIGVPVGWALVDADLRGARPRMHHLAVQALAALAAAALLAGSVLRALR